MKKIVLYLIAFSISALLYAQEPLTKREEAVRQTVVKMFGALSDRDSLSLKNYCTADITLYEYGQLWDIDTLILRAITLNQSPDFKRTNNFEFINTTVDMDMAWVTYRLQSTITKDGKQATIQWLETVVLFKQRQQWKVRHLHSTLLKRG